MARKALIQLRAAANDSSTSARSGPGAPDDAEHILRDWARPVLIVHGRREMTFPVSVARRLHAALPASTLAEIPGAAHMAHFDNPGAWLAAIRAFLSLPESLGR
jgi:pimeloyl-ACP methyl ester carboxylesterase